MMYCDGPFTIVPFSSHHISVYGASPCPTLDSGVSLPVLVRLVTLSQSFSFLVSMGCQTFAGP